MKSLATAGGWTFVSGQHGMTAQATRGGRPAMIFVAGANSYKHGSDWVPMGDTTVLIDGELWVPVGAMSAF